MIRHIDLGERGFTRIRNLKILIDKHEITLAGNSKLKIYGKLNCKSGKRMKLPKRIFFENEAEAASLGYRPCGNCMFESYKIWKATQDYNNE